MTSSYHSGAGICLFANNTVVNFYISSVWSLTKITFFKGTTFVPYCWIQNKYISATCWHLKNKTRMCSSWVNQYRYKVCKSTTESKKSMYSFQQILWKKKVRLTFNQIIFHTIVWSNSQHSQCWKLQIIYFWNININRFVKTYL